MELADFEKMEQIRARVDDDRRTTRTPPRRSSRTTASSASDRASTTSTSPRSTDRTSPWSTPTAAASKRITDGVVVDCPTRPASWSREFELDCLIYATGFEVGTDYTRRAGYELYGRDGVTLTEKWADGASTLHGMHSSGFPNCFIFSITQSGFTVNFPHMLNEQSKHLAYILRRGARSQAST